MKCLDSNNKMHLIKIYGLKLKQFYLGKIMGMLMQFLLNQTGKIQKKLSFEIKNVISRIALDLFTRDFLIHKSILMALFPQAFSLSTKATEIFARFAVYFEAMEQDTLQ